MKLKLLLVLHVISCFIIPFTALYFVDSFTTGSSLIIGVAYFVVGGPSVLVISILDNIKININPTLINYIFISQWVLTWLVGAVFIIKGKAKKFFIYLVIVLVLAGLAGFLNIAFHPFS